MPTCSGSLRHSREMLRYPLWLGPTVSQAGCPAAVLHALRGREAAEAVTTRRTANSAGRIHPGIRWPWLPVSLGGWRMHWPASCWPGAASPAGVSPADRSVGGSGSRPCRPPLREEGKVIAIRKTGFGGAPALCTPTTATLPEALSVASLSGMRAISAVLDGIDRLGTDRRLRTEQVVLAHRRCPRTARGRPLLRRGVHGFPDQVVIVPSVHPRRKVAISEANGCMLHQWDASN
jgi:hypothetical protein